VVLKNKADGRQVVQGLMRPAEVVLDEPLGEPPVEIRGVRHQMFPRLRNSSWSVRLNRSLTALSSGVCARGQWCCRFNAWQASSKWRWNSLPLSVWTFSILPSRRRCSPAREVAGGGGAVARVHPGEGDLRVPVDGGEDIALAPVPVPHHGIQARQRRKPDTGLRCSSVIFLRAWARLRFRLVRACFEGE
jgi:hypothetical protein